MISTQEIKEEIREITSEPNERWVERIKDFFEDKELTSVSDLRKRLIFILYNYQEMHENLLTGNKTNLLSIHNVVYRVQIERDNLKREKNDLERERNE
jgi:hypothetical protein